MRPLTLVATGLLVLFGASACGETPTESPDPEFPAAEPLLGRVIFTSVHPDSSGGLTASLWTMRTDGTDKRLLVAGRQWPESPTVSPDGMQVAFEDAWGLFIVDAGGNTVRKVVLPNDGRVNNPKWSPDGQWIAFDFQALPPSGQVRIYKIHPDGTGLTPVSALDGATQVRGPAWSADGGRMAYVRDYPTAVGMPIDRRLIVKDLTTGVETIIADSTTGFNGQQPAWSPDGTKLLFLTVQGYDWAIGQVIVATGVRSILGGAHGNRPASYDPAGTHLLFGTGDLWVSDADGGNAHPFLADERENFEAFWTPAAPASP